MTALPSTRNLQLLSKKPSPQLSLKCNLVWLAWTSWAWIRMLWKPRSLYSLLKSRKRIASLSIRDKPRPSRRPLCKPRSPQHTRWEYGNRQLMPSKQRQIQKPKFKPGNKTTRKTRWSASSYKSHLKPRKLQMPRQRQLSITENVAPRRQRYADLSREILQ